MLFYLVEPCITAHAAGWIGKAGRRLDDVRAICLMAVTIEFLTMNETCIQQYVYGVDTTSQILLCHSTGNALPLELCQGFTLELVALQRPLQSQSASASAAPREEEDNEVDPPAFSGPSLLGSTYLAAQAGSRAGHTSGPSHSQ